MGNAVRITHNHIYGNTAGISTDTISAGGHPGFPADSVQIDHNYIYSNNLDLFQPNPPVDAARSGVLPSGVGHLLGRPQQRPRVHDNWIWDNWRDGASLLSIPDFLRHARGQRQSGRLLHETRCSSTSCGNRYFDNQLGRVPEGLQAVRGAVRKFGNQVGADQGRRPQRRRLLVGRGRLLGTVTGNCWYNNTGPDGTAPA